MKKSSVIKTSLLVYVNKGVGTTKIIFVCGCEQMKNEDKDLSTIFGFDIPSLCTLLAEPRVSQFIIQDTLVLKSLCSTPAFPAFGLALIFHRGGQMLLKDGYIEEYFRLLKLLLRAYRREEIRVGYLSDQINIFKTLNQPLKQWKHIERLGKERTRLGKELNEITKSVRMGSRLYLRINGWVVFGFRCPSRLKDIVSKRKKISVIDSCVVQQTNKTSFPDDGLMDIKLFLSWTTPEKSLRDIAATHIPSISLIQSLAQHLLDWGTIRVIPKLVGSQIIYSQYRIIDFRTQIKYKEKFLSICPPLLKVLEDTKQPKTFESYRESLVNEYRISRDQFNSLIVWLIQSNFMKQMQTFIYFENRYKNETFNLNNNNRNFSVPSISTLDNDMKILQKYLKPKPSDEAFDLLKNILPLCDGTHSIEEICAVKNVEESDVFKVIRDFKSVLITFQI